MRFGGRAIVGYQFFESVRLGEEYLTVQLFEEMRPLQAVHHRSLDLRQVEADAAIAEPVSTTVWPGRPIARRGVARGLRCKSESC